tara:strand:+ start:730 stop:990 length:261 start_codon:yes stop_codon:yes gene_type:complete
MREIMHKIDTRKRIAEMGIAEVFAQVLSEKFDKPYEEMLKYVQGRLDKKIDEVEHNFYAVGSSEDISMNDPQDVDDFLKGKTVIKG